MIVFTRADSLRDFAIPATSIFMIEPRTAEATTIYFNGQTVTVVGRFADTVAKVNNHAVEAALSCAAALEGGV